jgi:hypothetical protein
MAQKIAIYDMDRTVTRTPTYPPFLRYAALRLAPWRLMLLPAVALVTFAYAARLIDRARLKEINFRLLVGRPTPAALEPVVERFAERQVAANILPGARAIGRGQGGGTAAGARHRLLQALRGGDRPAARLRRRDRDR